MLSSIAIDESGAARLALLWIALGAAIGAGAAWISLRVVLSRRMHRLRLAADRARRAERLAEMGAMSAGLAHEIKNPLSTIGLNAQLLAEGLAEIEMDPDSRGALTRRLDSLRREVERLRGILTDFLEFAGELRLDRRDVDLNVVVGELVDFYLPQAESAGVRVRADLAPRPLIAWIDAPLLKQAILNLMLNATQAMESASPENSGPDGSAVADRAGELILKTAAGLDHTRRPAAVLHVIDTGPGMTPETRQRLFEPYFTTKTGGTGLGLPTTRRIVEAHGGWISVFSEPGRGTDFVVTLPVAPEGRQAVSDSPQA